VEVTLSDEDRDVLAQCREVGSAGREGTDRAGMSRGRGQRAGRGGVQDVSRRYQEYLKVLRAIDKAVPADLDVHVICGRYATH
jgi:hypothetical protein